MKTSAYLRCFELWEACHQAQLEALFDGDIDTARAVSRGEYVPEWFKDIPDGVTQAILEVNRSVTRLGRTIDAHRKVS